VAHPFVSLDKQVRHRLREWPQSPPGMRPRIRNRDNWLRGRPAFEREASEGPYLKLPGSNRLRTLPDGLWLNFGGSASEPFVDIFAVEACGSLPNLLDKRSRFAPSTGSLLAVCPVPWLLAPFQPGGDTPRWVATGVLRRAPDSPLIVPVRDLRVLYGLKHRHFDGFVRHHVPHAHEYFAPMAVLTAEHGDKDPGLRQLLARASATANILLD